MRDAYLGAGAAVLATAFAVLSLTAPAAAQTADNDLYTSNGGEAWLIVDPTTGNPTGVLPPDWAGGNYYFNILHADRLLHASGTMTLTAVTFDVFDSDWDTSPDFFDMALTGTDVTGRFPDGTDPGVVYVSLGSSGLTNPCLLPGDPFDCADEPCVSEGSGDGTLVNVQVQFPAGGLTVTADGATNSALTMFQPGGMVIGSGTEPTCFLGDMVIMPSMSTDLPHLPDQGEVTGLTIADSYSGFQLDTGGGPLLGNVGGSSAFDMTFGFDEPTMNLRVVPYNPAIGSTQPPGSGLASHHLNVGSGLTSLGVEMHSLDGVGNTAVVAASLSTLPLPGAFVGPYGVKLMLTPDALFNLVLGAGAYVGPIVLDDNGGAPLDDGVFQSSLLSVPAVVPDGIELYFQGFELDGANDPVASTNVARITLWENWPPPPPAAPLTAPQPVPARFPTVDVSGRTRILDQWTEVGTDGVTRIVQSRIAALVHGDGRVEEVPVRVIVTPRPHARPVFVTLEDVLPGS